MKPTTQAPHGAQSTIATALGYALAIEDALDEDEA